MAFVPLELTYFCPDAVSFQDSNVNRTLDNGRKSLHVCADFGQLKVMEFLISKGADVNVGDAAAIRAPAELLGRTQRLSAPAGCGQTRADSANGSHL